MAWNDKATIECEFSFKCPKIWNQLAKAGQKNVRFCHECQREVYLVDTEKEKRKHAAQGHCIAIPLHGSDSENDKWERGHAVGMVYNPFEDDLPEGQNPDSYARLKTFIRNPPQRDRA